MNKPTVDELKSGGQIITWRDFKSGEETEWIEAIGNNRSVVVFGEFGLDGICKIEGSNDKKNAGVLHHGFEIDLNIKTTGEFFKINEASRFIRPSIEGDVNLTVSIMVTL